MPLNVNVQKTSFLVMALAKFHNFCIGETCDDDDASHVVDIEEVLTQDTAHIQNND